MAARRTYDDPCGVARALDVVGERWALLVVRELLFGPKRFSDLGRGLPGISENVLSQRLRELEEAGLVRRRRLGPPASTGVYDLTDRGADLEAVLLALSRWGSRGPLATGSELSADALILALKTTFDPGAAGGLVARYELRIGADRFRVRISRGRFDVSRGSAEEPDAIIEGDVAALRSLIFGGSSLGEAIRSREVRVLGNHGVAARLPGCFIRPAFA
ncbi:MAG TPA: winged helix-turn-helix transcriptional regulator [Candidatus Dormibacteraeota bacterium]|jgi:DNA-binding HxlR family transcriptional regulator|nr:winged helix-turn-helix transcriptional regulator [Candidatus Dormibacteraeota bacterium]